MAQRSRDPKMLTKEMALFSLSQKIFVIKSYYKSGESVRNVLDCLYRRYGIKMNAENAKVIAHIIRAFEHTGNILNRFYYNVVAGSGAMKFRKDLMLNQPPLKKRPPPVLVRKKIVIPMNPPLAEQEIPEEVVEDIGEDDEEEEEIIEDEQEGAEGEVADQKDETGEVPEEEIIFEVLHEDAVELFADFETETETTPAQQQMITVARLPVKLPAAAAATGITQTNVQKNTSFTTVTTTSPVAKPPDNFSLCPECGETVPYRKFALHMRKHKTETENNEIHECPECARVFLTGALMKAHMKEQHGPNFICEICAKVSRTKATHKAHMFVHETERPHRCADCPKTFVRAEGLRRHRMTHTGEKPFICQYCKAAFGQFMGWQMHLRLHTGERPYACKHCDKRFIGSPALNAHLKSHTGEYTFTCSMCPGRYKTMKTLQDHLAAKHGVEEELMEEVVVVKDEEEIMV